MPSNRNRTTGLSRLSNEELILILERLDPESLWQFCKACRRIYFIVMGVHTLRYQLELGITGMKDGPVPHTQVPHAARLELLLRYKTNWPALEWARQDTFKCPDNMVSYGVSDSYFYQIIFDGVQHTIKLFELPSARTGVPLAPLRQGTFESPLLFRDILIDRTQTLLVTSRFFSSTNGSVQIQFDFRSLRTFAIHPHASALTYQYDTGVSDPALVATWEVCSNKFAAIVRSKTLHGGAAGNLLLMDWRTRVHRVWPDIMDAQLIDDAHLLIIHREAGAPALRLWDICSVPNATPACTYELPEKLRPARLRLHRNTAPRPHAAPRSALFAPDPARRVLAITATSPALPGAPPARDLLLAPEAVFRAHAGRARVAWKEWGRHALVRALGGARAGATIAGAAAVLLEGGASAPRLRLVRLLAPPVIAAGAHAHARALPAPWTWGGARAGVPAESVREAPEFRGAEAVVATEDNIVVFVGQGERRNSKVVHVLTFA